MTLYFDRTINVSGNGIGVVLISSTEKKYLDVIGLQF
jgi:hypothetical protein